MSTRRSACAVFGGVRERLGQQCSRRRPRCRLGGGVPDSDADHDNAGPTTGRDRPPLRANCAAKDLWVQTSGQLAERRDDLLELVTDTDGMSPMRASRMTPPTTAGTLASTAIPTMERPRTASRAPVSANTKTPIRITVIPRPATTDRDCYVWVPCPRKPRQPCLTHWSWPGSSHHDERCCPHLAACRRRARVGRRPGDGLSVTHVAVALGSGVDLVTAYR